jgi:hypothetical protein
LDWRGFGAGRCDSGDDLLRSRSAAARSSGAGLGTAEPGEQVTVKVGSAQATTNADAEGKWMLRLPAMKMNTVGQELVVTGKNTVTIKTC